MDSSSVLVAMLCVGVIVLAALGVLVYLLLKPKNKTPKTPQNSSANKSLKPKKRNWQIWILFFVIALVVAYWTALGALFFLAVVWVLRMNPRPDVSFTLSTKEKKTAKRVYTWLLWSPIFTVLIFIGTAYNLSDTSTINDRVLAALIPLILHLPLLLGLTSKSRFIYRHTQQGILLIALRAGMASLVAVTLENYSDYALLLFFFGNGLLWLIGSLMGLSQISDNKCWFMDRKSEKIIFPESTKTLQPATRVVNQELNDMLKATDAKEKALLTFRTGTPDNKKHALAILAGLGEVEKF